MAWTVVGLVLVVVAVPAFALNIIGSAAYQPLAATQRVFSAPIATLTVHVDGGDVTVARGTGPDTVVTTTGVHGLTYPTDTEHVVGQRLDIGSNCGTTIFNDRCSRSYVVHVPSGVAVTATSGQGTVRVSGMDRSVTAHSDQGDVAITGGSGSVEASSGQGSVTVSESSAASVSARSGQGDVVVDLVAAPNRVTATSGQGSVSVELPKGSQSYQVHANSGQGSVSNSVGDNPSSNRVVTATSGQGDVTVGYRAD
jgi:hypothetical protein